MHAVRPGSHSYIGSVVYQNESSRVLQNADHFLRQIEQKFCRKDLLAYLDKIYAVFDRITNGIQDRSFSSCEIFRICFARSDQANERRVD